MVLCPLFCLPKLDPAPSGCRFRHYVVHRSARIPLGITPDSIPGHRRMVPCCQPFAPRYATAPIPTFIATLPGTTGTLGATPGIRGLRQDLLQHLQQCFNAAFGMALNAACEQGSRLIGRAVAPALRSRLVPLKTHPRLRLRPQQAQGCSTNLAVHGLQDLGRPVGTRRRRGWALPTVCLYVVPVPQAVQCQPRRSGWQVSAIRPTSVQNQIFAHTEGPVQFPLAAPVPSRGARGSDFNYPTIRSGTGWLPSVCSVRDLGSCPSSQPSGNTAKSGCTLVCTAPPSVRRPACRPRASG